MKQTKIRYQDLADGKIKIVAIENAATRKEIIAEFGEEVLRVYQDNYPWYINKKNGTGVCVSGKEIHAELLIDHNYSQSDFKEIIADMKRAAERLIEIRQKVADYEVKEIII